MNLKTLNDERLQLINQRDKELEAVNNLTLGIKTALYIQNCLYKRYEPLLEKIQIQYNAIETYIMELPPTL